MTRLAGFLTAVALMACSSPLWAQTSETAEAHLSALAFGAIDKSQPVQVRLQDDSPDNKAIKAELEQALTQAGYRLAPNARYILTFEATNSLTAPKDDRPTVFSVEGQKSSFDDKVEARVKVFSTGEDSLFKRRPDEGPQGTAGSVRLDLGLIDHEGGKRLWQGWAQVSVPTSDTMALTRAMAAPLVANIGKAMRDKKATITVK